MKLVIWIHGIEPDNYDEGDIGKAITEVESRLPRDSCVHHAFNWANIVRERERLVYDLVKHRGNMLTRVIRKYICQLGLDMWFYLSTKRQSEPGDWYFDIHSKLQDEIGIISDALMKSNNNAPDITFIGHSWGSKIALDAIINNPDRPASLITLGSPLPIYGSACFADWGDPSLLANLRSWTNISITNDPISNLMKDNPNPAWKRFVKDYDIPTWGIFPMKAHTSYWGNGKVLDIIVRSLSI